MQRLIDVMLSSVALILLSPFLLLIMAILRVSGEGEVFFAQERVGRGGKPFKVYKFATMLKNSPSIGTGTITVENDARVLPVGRFLRKTKLNELPQLVNVLIGDMSIIGPRPQTRRCFDAFPARARSQIAQVRPGLSGVGSIVFRNEERIIGGDRIASRIYDDVIMPYKGMLEEWYVEHNDIWMYLVLMGLTVWVLLFPDSRAVWRMFPGLPQPCPRLASLLIRY